jgi:outer membrane lipoprotein SlyB
MSSDAIWGRTYKRLLKPFLWGSLPLLVCIFFFNASCASKRPVLYPNERLREAGQAAVQQDIEECLQLAEDAGLEPNPAGKVAGQTAAGAVTGTAVGAAVGAVTGHAKRGAAIGAAGGGARGFMRGLFGSSDLDPIQKRFVEECLREKGYKPIGWR